MARENLRSVTTSRHLSRAGLWATGPQQLTLPIEARGLSEVLVSSGRLNLTPDYDVLAWLCERWLRRPTDSGWMRPSFYEIGWDLYSGPPSGKDYRTLRESLTRLSTVSLTLLGIDGETGEANEEAFVQGEGLLKWTGLLRDYQRPSGLTRPAIQLGEWLRDEIDQGAPLRLNWRVLRGFSERQKLAKRLWVYLAAERWRRQGDGNTEATWIAVGDWLFSALGMNYAQPRQARAALKRACLAVATVDERIGSGRVELERLGSRWRLIAERPSEGVWAERRQIRAQAHESLGLAA